MKTKVPQYTVRNLPAPVDQYLRRRAQETGRSLNQTLIDELSERAGLTKDGKPRTIGESLSWFIGSSFDPEVERILAQADKEQKKLAVRELRKIEKSGL